MNSEVLLRGARDLESKTYIQENTMSKTEYLDKDTIINNFKTHEGDTGSCEVQIALLTARITHLTQHLSIHKKDFHTRRGLVALANRRRKLLNYLKREDFKKYNEILQRLELRR